MTIPGQTDYTWSNMTIPESGKTIPESDLTIPESDMTRSNEFCTDVLTDAFTSLIDISFLFLETTKGYAQSWLTISPSPLIWRETGSPAPRSPTGTQSNDHSLMQENCTISFFL